MLSSIVRLVRPKQWVKNLLVLFAPIAAGMIFDLGVWKPLFITFISFSLAASATYILNDYLDIENDRAHPNKRHRPLASGAVPVSLALSIMAGAAVASLALPYLMDLKAVTSIIGIYLVVQTAYCFKLKHVVLLDILCISSGFILRAIGGAAAVGLMPSQWFLLVTFFASLLIAAGKRASELKMATTSSGDVQTTTRPVLHDYTLAYLAQIMAVSAAVVITAYGLWAFETGQSNIPFLAPLSIVPVVFGLLRYILLIDRGDAEAPEEVFLRDRQLQLYGLTWAILFIFNVYVR
jgi:decaprenyl-phosphate phosphoribosyltransferase